MQYKVANAGNIKELEEKVSNLMGQGFCPSGSLVVSEAGSFYQPMTNYIEDNDEPIQEKA